MRFVCDVRGLAHRLAYRVENSIDSVHLPTVEFTANDLLARQQTVFFDRVCALTYSTGEDFLMTQLHPELNPFALMTDPQPVFAVLARSEGLSSLKTRVCRPLAMPSTRAAGDDEEEFNDAVSSWWKDAPLIGPTLLITTDAGARWEPFAQNSSVAVRSVHWWPLLPARTGDRGSTLRPRCTECRVRPACQALPT